MSYKLRFAEEWYCQNKNKIPEMYRIAKIPKRNGKYRTLEIPNYVIASFQNVIKDYLNYGTECSQYAEAYQKGKGMKFAICKHINQKLLLKLDIKDFFGSITTELIKNKVFIQKTEYFMAELCCCNGHLPQGACTSPIISNLVMKEFDDELGQFCTERGINFGRYSDDMIFSGDFNPGIIIRKVKEMLHKMGMELNTEKTVIAGPGSRQMVLGVVVNEKMQLSSESRRKIRKSVYYCNKYGVSSHIVASNEEKYIQRNDEDEIISVDTTGYIRSLMGKILYALYINPQDAKMVEYCETMCMINQK
jgi:retron-type reverse transcriptase